MAGPVLRSFPYTGGGVPMYSSLTRQGFCTFSAIHFFCILALPSYFFKIKVFWDYIIIQCNILSNIYDMVKHSNAIYTVIFARTLQKKIPDRTSIVYVNLITLMSFLEVIQTHQCHSRETVGHQHLIYFLSIFCT